jgi:hypothetical protein
MPRRSVRHAGPEITGTGRGNGSPTGERCDSGLTREELRPSEARSHAERRYLEGSPTLFPDLATDCQALREQAEQLAGLGHVLSAGANASSSGTRHLTHRRGERQSTCAGSVLRSTRNGW